MRRLLAAAGVLAALAPVQVGAATPVSPPDVPMTVAMRDVPPLVDVATGDPVAAPPFLPRPERGTRLATVRRGRSVPLRAGPGGRVLVSADSSTEFGSRTILSVARERGRWLGVRSPDLLDDRLGWVDRRSHALTLDRTGYSIVADLSRRRVELLRGDRVTRRLPVAIGRPESPTPTGRYAVTDELAGTDFASSYGCCIIALSGHQRKLPAGWQGGDRLALHGTDAPATVGTEASAGCLRADDGAVRALMRRVPLGTPVRIKR